MCRISPLGSIPPLRGSLSLCTWHSCVWRRTESRWEPWCWCCCCRWVWAERVTAWAVSAASPAGLLELLYPSSTHGAHAAWPSFPEHAHSPRTREGIPRAHQSTLGSAAESDEHHADVAAHLSMWSRVSGIHNESHPSLPLSPSFHPKLVSCYKLFFWIDGQHFGLKVVDDSVFFCCCFLHRMVVKSINIKGGNDSKWARKKYAYYIFLNK